MIIDQNSISRYDTKVAKEHMKKGIRVTILYWEFKFNTTMFIIFIFESVNGCKIEP